MALTQKAKKLFLRSIRTHTHIHTQTHNGWMIGRNRYYIVQYN